MRRVLTIGLTAIVLVAVLWTWFTLSWSYSDGERAGVIQKFSRKGWVCKTYEGELALYIVGGVAPEIWAFSVRDKAVVEQLNSMVGERVRLHYTEHKAIPSSCFAETAYFVDRVTRVEGGAAAQAPPP
ncbi:MAG: hypothetical protein ABL964_02515 [Steroidobacteraceae bacterium]